MYIRGGKRRLEPAFASSSYYPENLSNLSVHKNSGKMIWHLGEIVLPLDENCIDSNWARE
jgi:hypothetical protein